MLMQLPTMKRMKMTDKRYAEIMDAVRTLKAIGIREWRELWTKGDDIHLPYLIAQVAVQMNGAVRDLCPPGYEVDR